jgi:Malectin domain/Right handed beta helix region
MRVRPPLLPIPTAIPGSPTNTSQAVRPHANSNSVSGTSYPQVYGTERYGNAHASFGYSIPLADGNYNVTLDFAETYVTAAGQRIFSVSINGTQVLTNFDIYAAAGGMNIAVQRTFPVTVTNGTLSVNFIPGAVENPKINGMEVVESSGSGSGGSSASDCTLFASPSGNDSNSGTSASSPKTFQGAANATQPGSVVCLLGGTYNFSSSFTPPTSGTPSSWITYKNYGDGPVNIVYTGPADASPIFRLGSGSFPTGGVSYIEFRGLNLNGNSNSGDAFWCQGTHHLRFINNSMSDTGTAGIGTRDCDYLTADHNLIYHNGYMPASTPDPQWYGWTSGISYNSNQWFDTYPGFHNIISNNIVAGEFDSSSNHTDGNGIILDLSNGSYNASTANTPPVLIINNVVYGNGGRCIHAYIVTNFWIVNNTCYNNNLDPTLGTAGSFSTSGSQNGYFINNISLAWSSAYPTYIQEGSNSNIQYFADMYYGSSPNFSSSQLIQANPLFVSAPSLTQYGYSTALPPLQLGTDLTLQSGSPAFGKGIDPSTLSGLPSAIVSDLKNYIYADINGKPRPQGGGSDLGAYQH